MKQSGQLNKQKLTSTSELWFYLAEVSYLKEPTCKYIHWGNSSLDHHQQNQKLHIHIKIHQCRYLEYEITMFPSEVFEVDWGCGVFLHIIAEIWSTCSHAHRSIIRSIIQILFCREGQWYEFIFCCHYDFVA